MEVKSFFNEYIFPTEAYSLQGPNILTFLVRNLSEMDLTLSETEKKKWNKIQSLANDLHL